MSFVERKIILNYLKNLDETNLQKNGSKIFQDGAILNKMIKKDEFIQDLVSSLPDYKHI